MSGQATGWVLRYGPKPTDVDAAGKAYGSRARGLRAVLVAVADAANRDGEHAHPGLAALVDGSLYSRRQVQKLVDDLVADGWLTIEEMGGGRGKATVYSLPRMKGAATAPFDSAQSESPKGAVPLVETVQSDADTVQPPYAECASTVSATDKNNEQPTLTANQRAKRICDHVWQNRKPQPAMPFPAALKAVARLLEAGHSDVRVQGAAMSAPTITVGAMEFLLNRSSQPSRPLSNVTSDRSAESGAIDLDEMRRAARGE